jgi:RNA polymerase sigma-70 factor (ECF subfamily)
MDDQTQREVVAGLRRGCQAAWLAVYDAYAARVWREVARSMRPDWSAVEDVVQETFLAAARSARGFDPRRGTLWNWLWGIAWRQIALHRRREAHADRLRQAARWWNSLDNHRDRWLRGEAEAPPEVLASRELATLVRAALAELPAEDQLVLSARYMDGATADQIAVDLGRSVAAVRSRLARARSGFRRAFVKLAGSSPSM